MKLTNTEIDILQELISKRLNEINNGPRSTVEFQGNTKIVLDSLGWLW